MIEQAVWSYVPTGEFRLPNKGEWYATEEGVFAAEENFCTLKQYIYRRVHLGKEHADIAIELEWTGETRTPMLGEWYTEESEAWLCFKAGAVVVAPIYRRKKAN